MNKKYTIYKYRAPIVIEWNLWPWLLRSSPMSASEPVKGSQPPADISKAWILRGYRLGWQRTQNRYAYKPKFCWRNYFLNATLKRSRLLPRFVPVSLSSAEGHVIVHNLYQFTWNLINARNVSCRPAGAVLVTRFPVALKFLDLQLWCVTHRVRSSYFFQFRYSQPAILSDLW